MFDDMTELCRLKLDSKRTSTPVTKAKGKRRRDIDDDLEQHDVQASKEVAGTDASSTGASSIQFTLFVVCPEETGTRQTRACCMSTRTRIGQQKN